MTHLDLFTGYGGFTISAEKLGWKTVGFSEIDPYAIRVLNLHYPDIKNYGDITKIKSEDLPTVDIITGGTPCQDMSVAGKHTGLNGKRSGLFFHFIRIVREKQPRYFIWENVKGALGSNRGWDFARVQIEMEQAGYDVQWQVVNAKNYGVPQNRERIFAIGIRRGYFRKILFEQRESRQNIKKIIDTGHDGTNIFSTEGIAPTQKAMGGGQGAKTGLYAVTIEKHHGSLRRFISQTIFGALTASYYKGIRGAGRPAVLHNQRVRRLTPLECERLMGLEDEWTGVGISDTQRYKLCGNGVVINCVDYILNLIDKL